MISELGRTQYNLGAVVFTLNATDWSCVFVMRMFCFTTRVNGPKWRIFIVHLQIKQRNIISLRSNAMVSSRSIWTDITGSYTSIVKTRETKEKVFFLWKKKKKKLQRTFPSGTQYTKALQ